MNRLELDAGVRRVRVSPATSSRRFPLLVLVSGTSILPILSSVPVLSDIVGVGVVISCGRAGTRITRPGSKSASSKVSEI